MQFIRDAVEKTNLTNICCSVCCNFLSIQPIAININGSSVCGRCIKESSVSVKRNHLYEILAKGFLFPCMNYSEGCGQQLSSEKLDSHEKSCSYRKLKCFCTWSGNSFNFVQHYEKKHAELIIQVDDVFCITDDKCRLLKHSGLYFSVSCMTDHNTLKLLNVHPLTNASHESNAKIEVKQIGPNLTTDIVVDHSLKSKQNNEVSLIVDVADDYIKNLFKTIICPNCSVQMTPPIVKCLAKHITCLECLDPWLDYCKMCENESVFTCDTELQCIALAAPFSCRWNCGKTFTCSEIRGHELGCKERLYKCWHSLECDWFGYLNELVLHDQTCIDQKCIFKVNVPEVQFLGTVNSRRIDHLIVFNCCFNVIYDCTDEITSLFINHYDIYGFGWFRFIAELMHVENAACQFNKTYELPHSQGGIYKIHIPKDDIIKFDGAQYYKITVKVILLNEEERKLCTSTMHEHLKNYTYYRF